MKSILIFTSLIVFNCITSQLPDLSQIEPSHELINNLLIENAGFAIKKVNNKNSLCDVIIIKIKGNDIYIKASNFESEQLNCQLNICEKPTGYFINETIPFLLYGELSTFFKKIKEPEDILCRRTSIEMAIDIDEIYRHYSYRKDSLYGIVNENFEFMGLVDNVPN